MTVTNGELLAELGVPRGFAANRIAGSHVKDAPAVPRPWYVQTVVAAVLWVGALFFASFLASLRIVESPGLQLVLGVGFLIVGALGSRARSGLLRLHLALLGYIGATSMLALFGDRGLRAHDAGIFLWMGGVQLVSLVLFDSRPVRFKATLGMALSGLGLVLEERIPGGIDLLVLLGAAVASAWWLFEANLAASPVARAVRPIGFGLVVAALGASLLPLAGDRHLDLVAPWWLAGALGALLCGLTVRATREAGAVARSGVGVAALVGALALAALSSDAPSILVCVLVLVLGRMRKEPLLDVLGATGLVVLLVRVYYHLELSLLWTSFALAIAGVALLVARAVLLRGAQDEAGATASGSVLSPVWKVARTGSPFVLVPALLVGVTVMGLVARKEQQLAEGRTVLLRLAPTDPRSLLQGDYMTLRYQLAEETAAELAAGGYFNGGLVRVHIDTDGVAARLAAKEEHDVNDVAIRWHRVRGNAVFGADSFFFAEGDGPRVARATFAEVRVTPDGTPVLVRLLDENRAALTP